MIFSPAWIRTRRSIFAPLASRPHFVAMTPSLPITRRAFAAGCCVALLGLRRRGPDPHPTPRPGITAAKVVADADLADAAEALPAFAAARRIPQILDGIRCHCGCATLPGFYSLLSCYEGDGMARMCLTCQGQARLADRLERAGKSLDQIRSAIDARFG